MPAASWRRAWKAGNLMLPRFGVMLKPSLGTAFTERYTSSLAAIRASHFQQPDSAREQTTHAISGPSLQMQLDGCGQSCASLRTSKDTLALDSEKSLGSWKASVIEQRGDYSRRLKLARLTSENGSLSWPTVTANEDSYRIGGSSQASKCLSGMARRGEMSGPVAQASPSSLGSRPESWPTPNTMDTLPNQLGARLNPRWVETLMGLPVGFTMPSCAAPVTIAPTSSDCSATASFQPQQSELFASSQGGSSNE